MLLRLEHSSLKVASKTKDWRELAKISAPRYNENQFWSKKKKKKKKEEEENYAI